MDKGSIIALAALAVLLLVAGMVALILPEAYEGQELYRIDEMHAIRVLDLVGAALLVIGSATAWTAGLAWQRRTYDT